jgi:hypothetical protein
VVLPWALRRKSAATSAMTKNGRLACTQYAARAADPACDWPHRVCYTRHRRRPGRSRHKRPDGSAGARRRDRASNRTIAAGGRRAPMVWSQLSLILTDFRRVFACIKTNY